MPGLRSVPEDAEPTHCSACNDMDPHEMIVWTLRRGWSAPSHPTWWSPFLVRHGAGVVQKPRTGHPRDPQPRSP